MKNTIRKDHNRIEVSIEVMLGQEGDLFVAFCPALDLSSYGRNEDEAKKAFNEALEIFFEEVFSKGNLERYLLQQGWQLRQRPEPQYIPPRNTEPMFGRLVSSFKEPVSIPV